MGDRDEEPRRSASAEAAALRRAEREPEAEEGPERREDEAQDAPEGSRPSASAEAAALRWREEHADD
jgi:hypothetical protein